MQARQIVLDTETTGLSPQEGHRIVEIACVEIVNGGSTGKRYTTYINPERDSHPGALKIHGLTREFLADKPKFIQIADDFLKFIGDAELIMHNAPFDLQFLNHELNLIKKPALKNTIIDTFVIAQQLYSKEFITTELVAKQLVQNETLVQEQKSKAVSDEAFLAGLVANSKFRAHSLDHLCLYFGINLSTREKHHGALVDCELLAQVHSRLKQNQVKNEISRSSQSAVSVGASSSSIVNVSLFQAARVQAQVPCASEIQEKKSLAK